MKRDVRVYCDDILECIDAIYDYTSNLSEQDFVANRLIQDAVLRRLEIIGEASKHLPKSVRDRYPEVPWQQITGTRDILVHQYFGIHLAIAWAIVRGDLAQLRLTIGQILADLDG